MVIFDCCYITLWLVEDKVNLLLALNLLAVETNLITWHNLCAELGNDNAVYAYKTCCNQLVSLTTRADTRLCNKTVETHLTGLLVRVELWIALALGAWLAFETTFALTLVAALALAKWLACAAALALALETALGTLAERLVLCALTKWTSRLRTITACRTSAAL